MILELPYNACCQVSCIIAQALYLQKATETVIILTQRMPFALVVYKEQ